MKRTSKRTRRTSRRPALRRNAMYLPAGQRVRGKGYGPGTVTQSFGDNVEVRWDSDGKKKWVDVGLITDLLTANRRRRTSRRNPTSVGRRSESEATRTAQIKKLESKTTHELHKLRMSWQNGPALTIEEERALDSIAIDVANTREVINGKTGVLKKVRKALGYTY